MPSTDQLLSIIRRVRRVRQSSENLEQLSDAELHWRIIEPLTEDPDQRRLMAYAFAFPSPWPPGEDVERATALLNEMGLETPDYLIEMRDSPAFAEFKRAYKASHLRDIERASDAEIDEAIEQFTRAGTLALEAGSIAANGLPD